MLDVNLNWEIKNIIKVVINNNQNLVGDTTLPKAEDEVDPGFL